MSTPAGWYDDGQGAQRWWDGNAWTEHVAPAVPEAVADADATASGQPEVSSQPAAAEPQPVAEQPAAEQPVAEQPVAPAAEPAAPLPDITAETSSSTPGASDASTTAPGFVAPGAAAPATAPYPGAPVYGAPATPAPAAPAYGAPAPGEYPAAPNGYAPAGGYPGAPGYAPEAPKKKSKLWILWVVLGGVVLLLIAAAAILIPLLLSLFSTPGGATGATDDESAAVAVVLAYDDAFDDADCDLYEQATTSAFRADGGYPDCASFESGAETFDDNTDEYEVEVTGVTTEADGSITVTTNETYVSYVDADGNELDTPEQAADPFVYTLVDDGGRWAIDDVQ